MWKCPTCETQNSEQSTACEVCGTSRSNNSPNRDNESESPFLAVKSAEPVRRTNFPASLRKGNRWVRTGLIVGITIGLFALAASTLFLSGHAGQLFRLHLPTASISVIAPSNTPTNTSKAISEIKSPTPHPPLISVPTVTSIPTSTHQVADSYPSPERFIRDYFTTINGRDYKLAWSMLSKAFQANHTYNEYTAWWDTVDMVEIILIEIRSQSDYEAFVYVEANYHYKNGVVTTGHTEYKLIRKNSEDTWLFDPN